MKTAIIILMLLSTFNSFGLKQGQYYFEFSFNVGGASGLSIMQFGCRYAFTNDLSCGLIGNLGFPFAYNHGLGVDLAFEHGSFRTSVMLSGLFFKYRNVNTQDSSSFLLALTPYIGYQQNHLNTGEAPTSGFIDFGYPFKLYLRDNVCNVDVPLYQIISFYSIRGGLIYDMEALSH